MSDATLSTETCPLLGGKFLTCSASIKERALAPPKSSCLAKKERLKQYDEENVSTD